jgi:hypothetical protein
LQDRRPRFQVVGHVAGELSTDFARDNSEQAAQLFARDAALEDLTLRTAVVGRQSIAAYFARALPSLPYGQGAQVRHFVRGAAGGGYEWTNPAHLLHMPGRGFDGQPVADRVRIASM